MGRIKVIAKNGMTGVLNQAVSMILQFIQRIILLRCIGVELLGISSTMTSILSALSLTELGFQTAIVFHLYKPLKEKDYAAINAFMNILRLVYRWLAIIFFVLACLCIPFLSTILKGTEINRYIIILFLIIAGNISVTYAMAYKRTLLYSDQKEYVCKFIDIISNIIFFFIKLVVIIVYKNFLGYWFLQIIQNYVSNLCISKVCDKKYQFLHKEKPDMELMKKIWNSVKNIFGGKVAGYIYGATDNIIISMKISPIAVGYYTNYTLFTSAVKSAFSGIFDSITPIIGNLLVDDRSKNQENNFRLYADFRFILANFVVVPWIILSGDLIEIMFGSQYIMDKAIPVLLGIDMYIHIIYSECWEYINGTGLFRLDKYISVSGAIINIIVSLLLSLTIGIEGILLGTVISQMFFWIARSFIVYKVIFKLSVREWADYWRQNGVYMLFTVSVSLVLWLLKNRYVYETGFPEFIFSGIIIELVILFLYFLIFHSKIILIKKLFVKKRK